MTLEGDIQIEYKGHGELLEGLKKKMTHLLKFYTLEGEGTILVRAPHIIQSKSGVAIQPMENSHIKSVSIKEDAEPGKIIDAWRDQIIMNLGDFTYQIFFTYH